MSSSRARRIIAGLFAAGLTAAGVTMAPSAALASPHHKHHPPHHCYQAPVQANPQVSAHKAGNGAVAVITVAHHLDGRATLTIDPGKTYRVAINDGYGQQRFATRKGVLYKLRVYFPSSPDGCVVGGSDSTTYRGGSSSSEATTASFVNASSKLSAQPPSNGGAEVGALLGVLGAGMLGAGTLSVAVNRRRRRTGSPQS